MTDFSHLDKMHVRGDKSVPYTIFEIAYNGVHPILYVKHAGETNKPYFNALLRRNANNRRIMQAGGIRPETLEESREDDRKVFPEYVITGWKDVTDANGKPVSYSKSECKACLKALPNHMFDQLRLFAGDPFNFTGETNAEELGKNSPSASSGS